ncbi:single-stranded nucleic acid binding R3H [Paraphysoderma sedebokerense]|nr:single-stranded nucleic acid binding R3H [Paraphysoderma sedebokerense]
MASPHTASDVLSRSDSAVRISPSPTPSGKNSSEDASGPFIDKFLLAALRNPNDRAFLLRLDTDIEAFMNDESRMSLEFPRMNSYQRLVVHRASAYWGLSHMLNQVKQCVVLHKTPDSTV